MTISHHPVDRHSGPELADPSLGIPTPEATRPHTAFGTAEVLVLPTVWVAAWLLALVPVPAPGFHPGQGFSTNALRWMLSLPAGWVFVVSGMMHTQFAKRTSQLIGWQTSGFQYELGFVCFGLGAAGVYASTHGPQAWIAVIIPTTTFLVFAGVNHVVDMVREHHVTPGTAFVCLGDFGLPLSLWALVVTSHAR
jgi:hypothetical protein